MSSIPDLEQIRSSFAENDYKTGIYKVHEWLETKGLVILASNHRLPYNLTEAIDNRKDHEKMELKCMQFLSYFVQISLTGFPQEYEDLRQSMDIAIQKFSEKIKCRRAVVVTYVTFYRHLQALKDKLFEMEDQDLDSIPDSVEEVEGIVRRYKRNIDEIVKRLGHLKEEKDRIMYALQLLDGLNGSSATTTGDMSRSAGVVLIDSNAIKQSDAHLSRLLADIQIKMTEVYESHKLLHMEFQIECKMLQLERDLEMCCDWLGKLENLVSVKYNAEGIGRGTLENDELLRSNDQLMDKFQRTYQYGNQLTEMYRDLTNKFKRKSDDRYIDRLIKQYKRGIQIFNECRDRLNNAHIVFLSLDETLNEVEDILVKIERTGGSFEEMHEKFEPDRKRLYDKFSKIKTLASDVCKKINYNLFGEPQPDQCHHEIDATEAVVKMKMFTLALKLKELDSRLNQSSIFGGDGAESLVTDDDDDEEERPEREQEILAKSASRNKESATPQLVVKQRRKHLPDSTMDSLESDNDLNKYLVFLDASRRSWMDKIYPRSLDQSRKNLANHKELRNQSDEFWTNLKQLQVASCDKHRQQWLQDWSSHIHRELEPRHDFLQRLNKVNLSLDEALSQLDDVILEAPANLKQKLPTVDQSQLTKNIIDQLKNINKQLPELESELDNLTDESHQIYNGYYNDNVVAVQEKLEYLRTQLNDTDRLHIWMLQIENLLPQIYKYNNTQLPAQLTNSSSSSIANLHNEVNNQYAKIPELHQLSRRVFGNTNYSEYLADQLALFTNQSRQPINKSTNNLGQSDLIEVDPNSRVEMIFELPKSADKQKILPRVDADQYNLLWYKDNTQLSNVPDHHSSTSGDTRIHSWQKPSAPDAYGDSAGAIQAGLVIDKCQETDSGVYQCRDGDNINNQSQLVELAIRKSPRHQPTNKTPPSHIPDVIYAPIDQPVELEIQLDSKLLRSPLEPPKIQLLHDNQPANIKTAPNNLQRNQPKVELVHQLPWQQSYNATNRCLALTKPAIGKSDAGSYQLLVNNKLIAQTEIKVGEPPKLLNNSNFTRYVHKHEDVNLLIPIDQMSCNHPHHDITSIHWTMLANDSSQPIPISNDNKYQVYRDAKQNPGLNIHRFTDRNSGLYKCSIANAFGSREAEIKLLLCTKKQDHSREECIGNMGRLSPTPPVNALNARRARGSIDAIAVRLGDNLSLQFPFELKPNQSPDVIWYKDNEKIEPLTNSKYELSYPSRDNCLLELLSATESDSGIYTAVDSTSGFRKTTRVEVMPAGCKPEINEYPQRGISVKVNQPAQLVCVVHSVPFADKVEWWFQPANQPERLLNLTEQKASPSSRYQFSNQPILESYGQKQILKLSINQTKSQDSGNYTVKCSNSIGLNQVTFPLTITGEAQHKAAPPRFTLPLQSDVVTSQGAQVQLKCKVNGNPAPLVYWTKDGVKLTNSSNIKLENMGERHELTIVKLQPSDIGRYDAIASNSLGKDSNSCQVRIAQYNYESMHKPQHQQHQQLVVPTVMQPQQRNPVAPVDDDDDDNNDDSLVDHQRRTQLVFSNTVVRSPPQFIATFTDELVQEGDDLVLRCCLIGQPEPVVWWSYNTRFLKDNPRFHMSRERDEYSLVMRDLLESDSGRYSITAENSSGLATCSALVIVEKSMQRSKSVDRTKYPTRSKPLAGGTFPCHTTLSHMLSPRISAESRMMQASPYGWNEGLPSNALPSNSRRDNSLNRKGDNVAHIYINDSSPIDPATDIGSGGGDIDVDVKSVKTKTIKTYHYSGPSGVELPGVGFISHLQKQQHHSNGSSLGSMSGSSSESIDRVGTPTPNKSSARVIDDGIVRAKFVPGEQQKVNFNQPESRFSVVESSDCDL